MDLSPVTVAGSAARTVTGVGSIVRTPGGSEKLSLYVDTSAISGTTPSITYSVEWSQDAVAFAAADPPDSFTALTVTGTRVRSVDVKGGWFRLAWAITGATPSVTFSATAYGI